MSDGESLRNVRDLAMISILLAADFGEPNWHHSGRTTSRFDKVTGLSWISSGKGISENVIWYVVRGCTNRVHLEHLAPHDLRRASAKLCHVNGGELEQIQFLLGHASVLTTERYLGCKHVLLEPLRSRSGTP